MEYLQLSFKIDASDWTEYLSDGPETMHDTIMSKRLFELSTCPSKLIQQKAEEKL